MITEISSSLCSGSYEFVFLIFDLWCTQPLIMGFRGLERDMGPTLMVSTSMVTGLQMSPGWQGYREPDKKTMDWWMTACSGGGERKEAE